MLLVTVGFNACKKQYPDGPRISFKKPEKRILGKWEIETAYVNGSDRTADVDTMDIEYYKFYDPGRGVKNHQVYDITRNGKPGVNDVFKFINDESELELSKYPANVSGNYIVPGFILSGDEIWTILRLTDKEMWLELENNGTVYETRFIKMWSNE